MEKEHALPRGKVRRPFALKPNLGSFHTYDALIKHIMKRASRMGLTQAQLSDFEKSLNEIASSLERLNIRVGNEGHPGNKKAALCIISEIAFCYKDPVQVIKSLSTSYSLIVKMADKVREGRLRPVPDSLERRAAIYRDAAKLLCSVSGLRHLRRDAVTSGNPGESTHLLPEISNPALIGYVHVSPSLQNGRGVDSRRPIPFYPVEGEKQGEYGQTVAMIMKRMILADRTNASWIKVAVPEIMDSILAIPFKEDKRRIIRLVAETCILYKDPCRILDGFRSSFAVLKDITENADAGKKYPTSPGKEKEAEDFARRVRMFTSIYSLTRIRTKAALSMNGNGATYEIEFVSMQELKDISYGRGQETQLPGSTIVSPAPPPIPRTSSK